MTSSKNPLSFNAQKNAKISNLPLLHYQFNPQNESHQPTLVFLHGLFGDLNNLGVIARAFEQEFPTLRIDLRNHGQSFHSETMTYQEMAQDVIKVLKSLSIEQCVIIGHSMGGKVAMKTAALCPDHVKKIVVIDIAPVNYGEHGHRPIFAGLKAVQKAQPHNRQAAAHALTPNVPNPAVQQFLLKAFQADLPERFRFNLNALESNYLTLMGWDKISVKIPTLFIKGGRSDYLLEKYQASILEQCPLAKATVIPSTGHWVHAEKSELVIRAIQRFLRS